MSQFEGDLRQGTFDERRARQARAWMWREVDDSLLSSFRSHTAVAARIGELEARVEAGTLSPTAAAEALLAAFRGSE